MAIEVDFNQRPILIWKLDVPVPAGIGDIITVIDTDGELFGQVKITAIGEMVYEAEAIRESLQDIS